MRRSAGTPGESRRESKLTKARAREARTGSLPEVELGRSGRSISRIGLGAMPLSIQGRPEDRHSAKRVIQRAVELGVTLIDTADVYCLGEQDIGHNERLIREALEEMGTDGEVLVATKGGLRRTGGDWVQDAHPDHLREACEGSLAALGVERIELYQLHAPDPQVPIDESLGELRRLVDEGKIRWVGLSNVDLDDLQLARTLIEIVSVQNRFNPWDRRDEENGLIEYCDQNRLTYIPYSPVGGNRGVKMLRRNEALAAVGQRLDASPEETVLAWVLSRSPSLCPIPGARRVESIESSVRSSGIELDESADREIERAFRMMR
jgi:aryl-alcohol dehydrogenase-like predicted oxidoreductase